MGASSPIHHTPPYILENGTLRLFFGSTDPEVRIQGLLSEAREALRSGRRDRAVKILLLLVTEDDTVEEAWRLMARLHPKVEHKLEALGNLLRLNPRDWRARLSLFALRQVAPDHEALGDFYEQHGNYQLAIQTYKEALKGTASKTHWDRLYQKLSAVEQLCAHPPLRIEHPMLMVLRLALGWTVPFALLVLVHGVHTLPGHSISWLVGTTGVFAGALLVNLATYVPRHPAWVGVIWPPGELPLRTARLGLGMIGGLLVLVFYLWILAEAAMRLAGYLGVVP